MSEMFPVPEGAVPARLRGLVVLSPRDRLMLAVRQRVFEPWRDARHSLAARISLAAIGMTVLLLVLGTTASTAMVELSARNARACSAMRRWPRPS